VFAPDVMVDRPRGCLVRSSLAELQMEKDSLGDAAVRCEPLSPGSSTG
jgi:hypothetical protein